MGSEMCIRDRLSASILYRGNDLPLYSEPGLSSVISVTELGFKYVLSSTKERAFCGSIFWVLGTSFTAILFKY